MAPLPSSGLSHLSYCLIEDGTICLKAGLPFPADNKSLPDIISPT